MDSNYIIYCFTLQRSIVGIWLRFGRRFARLSHSFMIKRTRNQTTSNLSFRLLHCVSWSKWLIERPRNYTNDSLDPSVWCSTIKRTWANKINGRALLCACKKEMQNGTLTKWCSSKSILHTTAQKTNLKETCTDSSSLFFVPLPINLSTAWKSKVTKSATATAFLRISQFL